MSTDRAYTAALRLYTINQMMSDYQREFGRNATDDVLLYRSMHYIVEGCLEFGDDIRTGTFHPAAPDTSVLVMVDLLLANKRVPMDDEHGYWWDAQYDLVNEVMCEVGTFAAKESA